MNFRTKRELLAAGFSAIYQLSDVGLTGLATDPEIIAEAQQRQLVLITKDTNFIGDVRYALGHRGILYIVQSRTELQDTIKGALHLAGSYPSLENLRFIVQPGGLVVRTP